MHRPVSCAVVVHKGILIVIRYAENIGSAVAGSAGPVPPALGIILQSQCINLSCSTLCLGCLTYTAESLKSVLYLLLAAISVHIQV